MLPQGALRECRESQVSLLAFACYLEMHHFNLLMSNLEHLLCVKRGWEKTLDPNSHVWGRGRGEEVEERFKKRWLLSWALKNECWLALSEMPGFGFPKSRLWNKERRTWCFYLGGDPGKDHGGGRGREMRQGRGREGKAAKSVCLHQVWMAPSCWRPLGERRKHASEPSHLGRWRWVPICQQPSTILEVIFRGTNFQGLRPALRVGLSSEHLSLTGWWYWKMSHKHTQKWPLAGPGQKGISRRDSGDTGHRPFLAEKAAQRWWA